MKITFLIQDISTQGGTERTTYALASAMASHNHTVRILSAFHADKGYYDCHKDVDVQYITGLKYSLSKGILARAKMFFAALRAFKRLSFDADELIITQKMLASCMAFIAHRSAQSVACEHYKFEMYNAPIRFVRSAMYRRFKMLVVLNKSDEMRFRASGVSRVCTIENMVPFEPHLKRDPNSRSIISVGRLTDQKGFDVLIRAIALIKGEMRDWTLHIYGEGEKEEELKALIHSLGVEHLVHLHPFTKMIEERYAASNFYVMSSRFEGFPMVLLEAAAIGLPIISTDCPRGPREILAHGGGVLVATESANALADSIRNLINDNELREQLSAQALRTASLYSPENIYSKWIEMVDSVRCQ